ncbi:hypothetical protein C2E20_8267 [Micractinium conductrix]|uniref:SGNH hydrolase-type esterase domain-containing protein n=1 Tax=Micractinium conductrix TaxID=554055 RepID=A0A2P6V1W4_9CHLO|nr:hypothetical protein C2E20_8267 [Micractinium conductrix]|eukprot:PSC68081.1 hypothetical protein C2E20_8267 [Micractinium conductrix]
MPWHPLLTREELLRGLAYFGSGARLHRLARKLLAGKPIKVFTLGGSVTGGGGASHPPDNSYVQRFFKFIQKSFPHSGHVLQNKAISASTAFLYSHCLQHHVPPDADLVSLEFSVNERSDAPFQSIERRSYEQLLRRLLALPGRPAVIMLHHYGWWEAAGDGLDRGLYYRQPEADLTTLAQYYDVPAVSVRAATYHLMQAGVRKFKVNRVAMAGRPHRFLAANGSLEWGDIPASPPRPAIRANFFYQDSLHPYDPGHQTLAELLAEPLVRAVWEVQAGLALAEADLRKDPHLKRKRLPPPMIPGNADGASGVCAMQEEFKGVVVDQEGFEYAPERPSASDFMHQKWGWRGAKPGAWAELELDTRASSSSASASGINSSSEADGETVVWLSHLRSYQGMGTARVACVGGCTCDEATLDGTWEQRVSLFWITRFAVSRHRRCRIRVTITDEPGQFPEEGHKVSLVAVMVTHAPLTEQGSLSRVEQLEFNV